MNWKREKAGVYVSDAGYRITRSYLYGMESQPQWHTHHEEKHIDTFPTLRRAKGECSRHAHQRKAHSFTFLPDNGFGRKCVILDKDNKEVTTYYTHNLKHTAVHHPVKEIREVCSIARDAAIDLGYLPQEG